MSRYGSNFREPPWVVGSPKEVMDWMDATHPRKKDKSDEEKKNRFLNNLHVKFDFDVPRKVIDSKNILDKIIGKKYVEEDFDLLSSVDIILRGLAKAKFRNTAKIIIDSKIVYEHPEKKSDLRDSIHLINKFSELIKDSKTIEITAIMQDAFKSTAIIMVRKIHKNTEHSVDIQIKGKIRKDIYHTFLNYLNEKIGFKE